MQEFVPAEGKEVFIATDSVTLLGKNAKCKTPDNPHLYKYLWPSLSEHFSKLTIKAMGGCKTADILREVEDIVNTKAGGDPAAFDHVLIMMSTLNELVTGAAGHTIKRKDPEHLKVFKKLGETLAPMKYKMVIGPGDEATWGI